MKSLSLSMGLGLGALRGTDGTGTAIEDDDTAAGAALLTPYQSGLALWLLASQGITQAAGVVSQWDDVRGAATASGVSSGTAKPAFEATGYNGHPSVKGDGTDDVMTFAALATLISGFHKAWTVIVAFQYTQLVDNEALFYWTHNAGGAGFYRLLENTSAFRSGSRDDSGATSTTDGPTADTNRHILTVINTGTQEKLRLDGTARSGDPVTTGLGTITTNAFSLFARDDGVLPCKARIAGMMIFSNTALSDADAAANEAYLSSVLA